MAGRQGLWASTYTKIAVGAVLAFVGVVGGIYVGNAIVTDRSTTEVARVAPPEDAKVAGEPFVLFDPGDLFPLEPCSTAQGAVTDMGEIRNGEKALFMFVSFGCGPCVDYLKFHTLRMRDRLLPGTREIVVLRSSDGTVPDEYAALVEGMTVVFYEEEHWRDQYHLQFWPTIVGVDESGFVQHVQSGFEGFLDYPLVEYFFDQN